MPNLGILRLSGFEGKETNMHVVYLELVVGGSSTEDSGRCPMSTGYGARCILIHYKRNMSHQHLRDHAQGKGLEVAESPIALPP